MKIELVLICMAFVSSLLTTFIVEKVCRRLRLFDLPGHRKFHKQPVPRLGGIAFFIVPLLLGIFFNLSVPGYMLLSAIIVYVGGFWDDLHPANSTVIKLLFQVPASFIFAWQVPIDFLNASSELAVFIRVLMAGYVLFMINAANLMDNMNGLTAGLSMIWLAGLAWLNLSSGSPQSTLLLVVLIFSILGFYLRNFPWGKIYMGDQGSQLLGFLVAGFSLLIVPTHFHSTTFGSIGESFMSLLMFSMVFIADVATVTVVRLKEGRPVWQGDQNHLSHRLVRQGFTPVKTALLLSSAQGLAILSAVGITIYFSS